MVPKFVLSCDVAKGKSTFGLFEFEEGNLKIVKRPKNYDHNSKSLTDLCDDFELADKKDALVMMESTYVYQKPLVTFLRSRGFSNIV